MSVIIYHNPRCSKSRETLKLIQEKGIAPQIVEYLKTPPSAEELDNILKMLGLEPQALLRSKESKEAGIDMTQPRAALIRAMVANPAVIERPIVVANGKAALGRPPENVLEIL
ncbi:arsenate reductase (glutaredoxin) [Telmatospirillum sp. J64-1]|uniref:arsenate reductase (glutaredoxin) n=1 Tax=Telmatospirillum sp. J64-1 TaxID=2502183 RepID=UPI00115DEEA4|nr:arsenate reductase (glutaredoxin) [Telmatospirillum sp. J64-1]